MDKQYFEIRMHKLESVIHIKGDKAFYQDDLYPKYEKLTNKRFSDMCGWLEEYYDNKYLFPQPSDFRKAKENTAPVFNSYEPAPLPDKNQKAEVMRICRDLQKKFNIGRPVKKSQVLLYKKAIEKNMIFHIPSGEWVSRDKFQEMGGNKSEFTFPEEGVV